MDTSKTELSLCSILAEYKLGEIDIKQAVKEILQAVNMLWVSVDDKSIIAKSGEDCLLLFENNEVRRLFEDDLPFELITHYMPLPQLPNK